MTKFKRHLLLIAAYCLSHTVLSAQGFRHSVGAGVVLSGSTNYFLAGTGMGSNFDVVKLDRAGLVYFPRINFIEHRYFSFSVGSPLMVGISWATEHTYLINPLSSYMPPSGPGHGEGDKSPHFAIELPLVADFNLALGSSRKNTDSIGLYLGGGYTWNHTTVTLSQGSQKLETYDPFFHAGIRFIRRHPISLGVSYKRNKQWGIHLMRDL
jgi:hypothetical protein